MSLRTLIIAYKCSYVAIDIMGLDSRFCGGITYDEMFGMLRYEHGDQ